jgi:F-type H+-transporting ATPase subunit a
MNTDKILNQDFLRMMPAEFITSMLVILTIIILTFVVYFKGRKADPLKPSKGIVGIAEMAVEFADNQVGEIMGPAFKGFAGFAIPVSLYICLGFLYGMIGIPNLIVIPGNDSLGLFKALPSPFTNLAFPLTLGFITFVLIQAFALHFQHFKYFSRFVAPIPFVNLLAMWAPMISLSLRLFGNAFAGFCLETLLYNLFNTMIPGQWGLVLAPVPMAFIHFYFDLFGGIIQTLVFIMITMMDIAQEGPEIETETKVAQTITLKAQTVNA